MPELHAKHAYPVAAGIMIVWTGLTYWYSRKKGWWT